MIYMYTRQFIQACITFIHSNVSNNNIKTILYMYLTIQISASKQRNSYKTHLVNTYIFYTVTVCKCFPFNVQKKVTKGDLIK